MRNKNSMKRLWFSGLLIIIGMTGCQTAQEDSAPVEEEPLAAETAAPFEIPSISGIAAGTYEGFHDVMLNNPDGTSSSELLLVHSIGERPDTTEPTWHIIAIFESENEGWKELAQIVLDDALTEGAAPDVLRPNGVRQVTIDNQRVWLEVTGIKGEEDRTFTLLSYYNPFEHHLSNTNSNINNTDAGIIDDIDADGTQDIILDDTNHLLLCPACDMRELKFRIFAWDEENERIIAHQLQQLVTGGNRDRTRSVNNQAVAYAQNRLWTLAQETIRTAQEYVGDRSNEVININEMIIDFYVQAWERDDNDFQFLAEVLSGNYEDAINILRPMNLSYIFSSNGPLFQGTSARDHKVAVGEAMLSHTNGVINILPNWGTAWFLRGFARRLIDPSDVRAEHDFNTAARLTPKEPLFAAIF